MFKVIGHATQKIKASLGPRQPIQSPTVALRASWEGPFCSKVRFPWILADQDRIGPHFDRFKVMEVFQKMIASMDPGGPSVVYDLAPKVDNLAPIKLVLKLHNPAPNYLSI